MNAQLTLAKPPIPPNAQAPLSWCQLAGDSLALAIANAFPQTPAPLLVITADRHSAYQLQQDICFFNSQLDEQSVRLFPDWEILPYDQLSPSAELISERLNILSLLPQTQSGVIIVPLNTLMQRLAPPSHLVKHGLVLSCGMPLDIAAYRQRLQDAGYRAVSSVLAPGEYAVRGAIFDIFPMGMNTPFRIDLFDNEIDSIRGFDPDSQRSTEQYEAVNVLPAQEIPLDAEGISQFRQAWRTRFAGNATAMPLYQDVSEGFYAAGLEFYLPLFYTQTANLFDYLPDHTIVIKTADLNACAQHYWAEVSERYEQRAHDVNHPILRPHEILFPIDQIFQRINSHRCIDATADTRQHGQAYDSEAQTIPDVSVNRKSDTPYARLRQYLNSTTTRTLMLAETAGRREMLLQRLKELGYTPEICADWQAFAAGNMPLGLSVGSPLQGFCLPAQGIALLPETRLYPTQLAQRSVRRKVHASHDPEQIIRDLTELSIGAPVVHLEHGVGRYQGLHTLPIGDQMTEFLMLEYADKAKVYVPVTSLHLISRYSGGDLEHAPLHRLGSDQWQKAKAKAKNQIRDVAADLLTVYAKRAARQGHAFTLDQHQYQLFSEDFPFQETPDQLAAIADIQSDLQRSQPMDRLICGDVGFGKTEVAMRAAFIAANSGKQVAILVPTTLLAQQHFNTFSDRFANWPIKVAVLSRMVAAKSQQATIDDVANGKIDILIGTHKLLNKSIQYHDLGLLIIDEEHRFGVQHKEKIKALRTNLDILTLTATPIPRTLNLAFSGIRDLSIIATPPVRRLATKTFVQARSDVVIKEAISREIMRGGQVYFLHNSVSTINQTAEALQDLLPQLRIGIAHGQMGERQLEQVMSAFYQQQYNVLVCTTIIESGIDVPSANTIIIDRADKLGLAQLHQIRGRVGRSHHQAYAYLMTPPPRSLTADAKKRLEAIGSLDDLGAGFTLATHDLEIRGAGEILGEEQSGHMQAIGFALYMEMLEHAIKALKAGKIIDLEAELNQGVDIDLQIPARIPADYMPDVNNRLTLYKRIASVADEEALLQLQVEIIDRFGTLPQEVRYLISATKLKLHAHTLGIKKIEANASGGRIEFNDKPNIDPMIIIKMVQNRPQQYRLEGATKLKFNFGSDTPEARLQLVETIITTLATPVTA